MVLVIEMMLANYGIDKSDDGCDNPVSYGGSEQILVHT